MVSMTAVPVLHNHVSASVNWTHSSASIKTAVRRTFWSMTSFSLQARLPQRLLIHNTSNQRSPLRAVHQPKPLGGSSQRPSQQWQSSSSSEMLPSCWGTSSNLKYWKEYRVFDVAGELFSRVTVQLEAVCLQAVSVSVTQVSAEAWSYANAPWVNTGYFNAG